MKKLLFMFVMIMAVVLAGCSKDDDPTLASISLDKTTLSIQIEDTYQFETTCAPSNVPTPMYVYESNNHDVVTVNGTGEMTAIGVGTAIITVSVANDVFKSTCSVTVTPIEAASITLNKETLELFLGEEETLTYTLSPENITNKNIEWSSSNNGIATVDSTGKVETINTGSVDIIVTINNNITDTCKVLINPVMLEGISLNNNSLEIEITDNSPVGVVFTPSNASNKKIAWSSSDNSIATISEDGVVTGIMDGSVVVTAVSEDGNFTATCNIDVKVNGLSLTQTSIETVPNQRELIWVKYATIDKAYINATWSSSNPSVATVTGDGIGTNSALIETNNIGTTTITARSSDGKKIAQCFVTVKAITDIVEISANLENMTIANPVGSITLHSRIVYPDRLDIVVTAAILLDENRRMISIIYNSDYCKFPAIPHYGNWGNEQFDRFNKWIVHYQFIFDGQTYKVEKNINSHIIGGV